MIEMSTIQSILHYSNFPYAYGFLKAILGNDVMDPPT
jgi:hypothetical protein